MTTDNLLNTLKAKELALQTPEVRGDAEALRAMLHVDFLEVGRSGQVYDLAAILNLLIDESAAPTSAEHTVHSQAFTLDSISEYVVALRFQSMRVNTSGQHSHHAWRISIWVLDGSQWSLRYHQATPCAPFAIMGES